MIENMYLTRIQRTIILETIQLLSIDITNNSQLRAIDR